MADLNNLRAGDVVDIVIKGARISDKHVLDKRLWFVLSDGSYQYLPMSAEGISVDRAAAAQVHAPVREDLGAKLATIVPDLPVVTAAIVGAALTEAGYQVVKAGEAR